MTTAAAMLGKNGITRTLNFTTNIKNKGEILCFERTAANDQSRRYARMTMFINKITRNLNFTTNIRITDRALF